MRLVTDNKPNDLNLLISTSHKSQKKLLIFMNKDVLQSLLSRKERSPKKRTRMESLLYGTRLDMQCRNAISVQKKYKEYVKPVKIKRVNSVEIDRQIVKPGVIEQYKEEIVQGLFENSVIIIHGGTGTGKTTEVPQILLEIVSSGKIIGCTQPRRTATISIAERMQKEHQKKEIGYSVRFAAQRGSKIKYMTEGVLLREILYDNNLTKYSVIILDEIHEKTVESLILLKYLLLLVRERNNLKLVLMSATIEEDILQEIGIFPIINIKEVPYQIKIHYLLNSTSDYIKSILEKIIELSKEKANILVFLTGVEDISILYHLLFENIRTHKLFVLHSKLLLTEQMAAVYEKGPKCILSTNISETSITIPGIKYVIDCGMYKVMAYDAVRNVKVMKIVPIQKIQAIQRSGRTGRTAPGECWRMYTESEYNSFKSTSISKIELEDLEYFIFTSIQLNLPIAPHENVQAAIARMENLKVIKNFKLCPLGNEVLKLPLSVTHSIFLLEAHKKKCAKEVSIILGMIEVVSSQNIRLNEVLSRKRLLKFQESDHLLLLYLYKKMKVKNTLGLNIKKVDKISEQLCRILKIPLEYPKTTIDKNILNALLYSHRYNICIRTGSQYKEIYTGVECSVSSYSLSSYADSTAHYVIYNEIVEIHKPILNIVTRISAEQVQSVEK